MLMLHLLLHDIIGCALLLLLAGQAGAACSW